MADPVEPDYSKMTVEELDAEFERTKGFIEEPPAAEPEPATEPATETVAAEPAKPTEPVVAEQATNGEAVLDDDTLEREEMRLQIKQLRTERERFEFIAGRNAGKVGHLQKQLQDLATRPSPREEEFEPEPYGRDRDRERPKPARASSELEDKVAELQASETSRAVEGVYSDFMSQIAADLRDQGVAADKIDAERLALVEQITPQIQAHFEPFGPLGEMNSKTVRKVVGMVLQSAYTDTKLAKIALLRRTASERKVSQVAESKIVKQAASPTGGGPSSTPSKPKRVEDMTAEEADAAMIAEFGDGRYRRPLRS